jgi:acetyl esterase/lipase
MELSRRAMMGAAAAGALSPWIAAPAGAQAPVGDLGWVDPELRPAAARLIAEGKGRPPLTMADLPAAHAHVQLRPTLPAPAFTREVIPGPPGAPELTVYVVNAAPGERRPAILHTHGGGYILGSARSDIPSLQRTAAALGCVIVTVEYRLAPETTYAGSMEDNYTGLKWLHANAERLGADPARIALMGESAGGGHAALLALTARDRGEVPVIFQALVYPMLDDRTGVERTPEPPIGTLVWTPYMNRLGWQAFLGHAPGTPGVPARGVPARYTDLHGLPPAWIGVGGADLFVDEDLAYADRLIDAHVPTDVLVVPGAFHGFDGIGAGTAVAERFTAAKLDALRRAFARTA